MASTSTVAPGDGRRTERSRLLRISAFIGRPDVRMRRWNHPTSPERRTPRSRSPWRSTCPLIGATVLHNSNKLALRLTPCDVFARVAPVGQEVAQFEVELAQRLAEVGCPVGAPGASGGPACVHDDGFAVTLWTYYEPVTPRSHQPTTPDALERLHVGMRSSMCRARGSRIESRRRKSSLPSPDLTPELADADRELLSGTLGSLRRAIDDRGAGEQLLHGEPHPGNVLSTTDGPLFIDLETCCRGPVEFDLAHVPEAVSRALPGR